MWNNADIEALDVDLEAIAAWYLARDVPWGVRLPAEWDLAIGQPLFTKRCFGMRHTDAPAPQATGGIHVQRAGDADLDIYVTFEGDNTVLLQLVAKLLDVAQDAGGKLGGQGDFNPYYYRYNASGGGLVRFVLDDFDALQEGEQVTFDIVDSPKGPRARNLQKV